MSEWAAPSLAATNAGDTPATTGLQETGGACASMLSCKTNSAKLKRPGGPVSRSSTSPGSRGGAVTSWAAKVCGLIDRAMIVVAAMVLARTARTFLQHGVCVAGFFLAGAECIGQPPVSATGLGSETGSARPSAQWFERQNQAAIAKTAKADRAPLVFALRTRIVL